MVYRLMRGEDGVHMSSFGLALYDMGYLKYAELSYF